MIADGQSTGLMMHSKWLMLWVSFQSLANLDVAVSTRLLLASCLAKSLRWLYSVKSLIQPSKCSAFWANLVVPSAHFCFRVKPSSSLGRRTQQRLVSSRLKFDNWVTRYECNRRCIGPVGKSAFWQEMKSDPQLLRSLAVTAEQCFLRSFARQNAMSCVFWPDSPPFLAWDLTSF